MANVLIFGGTGFIGRHLVRLLVDTKAAAHIRVADRQLPMMAGLTEEWEAMFNTAPVEFMQANLQRPQSIASAFKEDHGAWTYVINLASETKYGQSDSVYVERVYDVGIRIAQEAVKHTIQKYIEVSTYQVYEEGKKPRDETGKVKPWTAIAKQKLRIEDDLKAMMPQLPLVILRPAMCYGPYDVLGLAPRLICGAVYKFLQKKMKFIWSADLHIPTVHVRDAAKAIWIACEKGVVGETYNVVDHNDTDQGKLNKLLEEIYKIETGFLSGAINGLVKLNFRKAADAINDEHLEPWMDLCREHGIRETVCTPFIDPELLLKHNLQLTASKMEALGWKPDYPTVTSDALLEQIRLNIQLKQFPPIL